jgi:transketolase
MSPGETLEHSDIPIKTSLNLNQHAQKIKELSLEAVRMRRKIVEMGYINHIRLHYGALMSMCEIITLLYLYWLKLDPENPNWEKRDRFVLSKGHGAPAIYVALWMRGFFEEEHFIGFRRLNSILQGHPDRLKTPGVDCSSGSLGQGFAVACGMALAAKIDDSPFRIYALMSDGECNEGSIWEAAQIASNLHIDKLTVLLDWNKKSSYGWMAGRNDIEPLIEKWKAFNWEVFECDGHDFASISEALTRADAMTGSPSILLCHTIKGKGIPYVENYPTKPNILLSEDKYQECLLHLDEVEKELRNE